MDAVTYPNAKASKFLMENFVPLRIPYDEQPYMDSFKVRWTPRLFIMDPEGSTHHDALGFLPPDEIVPFLKLGQAKIAFNANRLDAAVDILEDLLKESAASGSAPEAVYLNGVSHFKKTHDAVALKKVYLRLKFDYPHSSWTPRAYPYWHF